MGEPMEIDDVVSRLDQLTYEKKATLAETFKEFNLFVKSRDEEISHDLPNILDTYNPSSSVGKLFKVKLVDRYRSSSFVVKLLQSDDTLYIAQTLKCQWFFEDIDDPVGFVAQVVPTLSLNTRMKVINKYAAHLRNTKAGDALYRELKSRYGIKSALPLLQACSENFIRNELPNVKTPLPPNVTLALFKKYPSLTTEYIKYLADRALRKHKQCSLHEYESTFVKLSQKDLKTFLNLFDSDVNVPYMKLGRRPTKNLLKNDTKKVLENYTNYSRILVDKTFFSRLSLGQLKKLYVSSLFPEKLSAFCSGIPREVVRSLKYVKPSQRSGLVLSSFREKYNVDMTSEEVIIKLDETWVAYLPQDSKCKWLEYKISGSSDVTEQARLLAQLPVNVCLPRLKKLLESQSDATTRSTVVSHLVSTVHINQHPATIKDLFAYIVKRFRNEVYNFRGAIVDEMCKFKELYLQIDSNDWAPINDFINIIKLNGEAVNFQYSLRKMFRYQVESAFLGKNDVDLVLKNYLDFEKSDSSDFTVEVAHLCNDSPCKGLYLAWLARETFEMPWVDGSYKKEFVFKLFNGLCEYNQYSKDAIEIPERILDVVEAELNDKDALHWKREYILEAIKRHPIPRLQKYVVEVFPEFMNEALVCKLLREDPGRVLVHVDAVVKKALSSNYSYYSKFFKKCRMYDGFGIAAEITKRCCELTVGDQKQLEHSSMVPNAVRVLSLLLQPAEFVKIVSNYTPDEKKIEEYSDEIRARYEVQRAVCQSFVNVSAPSEVLRTIREFAVGDFLKLVVGSLVSTCLKVPETKIISVLEEWINCPVSLRKHFLRLTNDVAPTDYRVGTFVKIFKTEKNVSLRLVLFKLLRNSFIEVPGDDTFATFKSIINQLTVDDEEALKLLIDVSRMEDDYISPYLQLLWQLVETDWGTVLKDGKSQILNLVDKNVLTVLSDEFCDTLMTHELTTKLPQSEPSDLLPLYLLWPSSHEVQMTRFDKITAILRPLITNLWDVVSYSSGRVFPLRQVVRNIVFSICRMSETGSFFISPVQMLTALKKFLHSVIQTQELLRESLCIDLAVQFHQHCSEAEAASFTKRVAQLYNAYIDAFGKDYGYSLVSALVAHVPADLRLELATLMLSEPKSDPMHHLVAVELLRNESSCDEKDIPKYKALVMQLTKSAYPSVQVAVNEFFHSLTVEM